MRIFRILFLHFVVLLSCSNLFAQHFKVGDIWYDILSFEDKTVAVTSLDNVSVEPATDHYKGSVIIPKSITYEGDIYFVKCIESCAFYECPNLTSVVIPNSVTRIGYDAFSGCSGLTSVVIPNSVTSVCDRAFEGCSGLTSVVIPNSVVEIGNSAFEGCSSLTSVMIPKSVVSIGMYAFYECI